jgi:hypothetical protein
VCMDFYLAISVSDVFYWNISLVLSVLCKLCLGLDVCVHQDGLDSYYLYSLLLLDFISCIAQSTAHQTIHFGLCTALITMDLVLSRVVSGTK